MSIISFCDLNCETEQVFIFSLTIDGQEVVDLLAIQMGPGLKKDVGI